MIAAEISKDLRRGLLQDLANTPGGLHVTLASTARSMEPTLIPGDSVQVRPTATYEPGDVVLIELGQSHVVHRILWSHPKIPWIVHRGDAAGCRGSYAPKTKIIGRIELPTRAPDARQVLDGFRDVSVHCAKLAKRALLRSSQH